MKKFITLSLIIIAFASCKKDSMGQVCYECIDQSGNSVGSPCGSNKTEARKNLTGTYSGVDYSYQSLSESDFDKVCKKK